MNTLLSPFSKNGLSLKNHIVMAPMTRSRAINNLPNELIAEYYGQRSGAGLIITEGTAPTASGLGYSRIPGIFSQEQIEGWKKTTEKVHANGSKIFMQLMHTGRVASQINLPEGEKVIGVSDIAAAGQIWTDAQGMQDHSTPHAMSTDEVNQLLEDFTKATENAIEAGFDGVELHAANGYLLEQFLNSKVNTRTDEYGGNPEKNTTFIVKLAENIAEKMGAEKIGIRISPFSTFNDMPEMDATEVAETYNLLAKKLNDLGIAYLHLSYNPAVSQEFMADLKANFHNTMILCNGLTPETAEQALTGDFADLVGFGRYYISNPDLDQRIAKGAALQTMDENTLYTPGAEGYTDYPTL